MNNPPKSASSRAISAWLRKYWFELSILVAGAAAINAIFIPRAFRETHTVNPEAAAQLGSFVGGYVGSFFALVGVVLLVATLKSQLRTSEKQHFETKYFELLKMHRDNVAALDIRSESTITGVRLFVPIVYELRSALKILLEVAKGTSQSLTQEKALSTAFCCIFFGTGPTSSRMLEIYLSDLNPLFVSALEQELNAPYTADRIGRSLGYFPFDGHQSRLGHYYRHLYQMVRYVDQQTLEIDKYEYVKTIRAQLSTHEQALLLINSLTPMGRGWWDNELIVKYRLVQNIPRFFFDPNSEIDLSKLFKPGYFEWEDIQNPRK